MAGQTAHTNSKAENCSETHDSDYRVRSPISEPDLVHSLLLVGSSGGERATGNVVSGGSGELINTLFV